jgi:hypothetical protein
VKSQKHVQDACEINFYLITKKNKMPPEIPEGFHEKPKKTFTDEEVLEELKDILY